MAKRNILATGNPLIKSKDAYPGDLSRYNNTSQQIESTAMKGNEMYPTIPINVATPFPPLNAKKGE